MVSLQLQGNRVTGVFAEDLHVQWWEEFISLQAVVIAEEELRFDNFADN